MPTIRVWPKGGKRVYRARVRYEAVGKIVELGHFPTWQEAKDKEDAFRLAKGLIGAS